MFLVVGLGGQQELAIDRCQRVDLYCVLYIDHCKYSQYSVCMSMYEYVFTAIIVSIMYHYSYIDYGKVMSSPKCDPRSLS